MSYETLIEETKKFLSQRGGNPSTSTIGLRPGFKYINLSPYLEHFLNFLTVFEKTLTRLNINRDDYLKAVENLCELAKVGNYVYFQSFARILKKKLSYTKNAKEPRKFRNGMIALLNELNHDIPDEKLAQYIDEVFCLYLAKEHVNSNFISASIIDPIQLN